MSFSFLFCKHGLGWGIGWVGLGKGEGIGTWQREGLIIVLCVSRFQSDLVWEPKYSSLPELPEFEN